jgi:hypothetical protein
MIDKKEPNVVHILSKQTFHSEGEPTEWVKCQGKPDPAFEAIKQMEEERQELIANFERMLNEDFISRTHAAEVLANVFYNFENQGDMATPYDLVEEEQKKFYIQRAIDELKK